MFDVSQIKKEELYRLIVDGRFHSSENGFLLYLEREPGCLPAAMKALQHALTNLADKNISPELIKQINYYVLKNVERTNVSFIPSDNVFLNKSSLFRKKDAYFNLNDDNATYEGCQQLIKRYQYVNAKILSSYEWGQLTHTFSNYNHYQAPSPDCIESLIFFICESYNAAILIADSDDDKLHIIASHLQYIAQLHPFLDGNIRTCYILLQRMLIQNGFPPSMMYNPNVFDGFKIDTLIKKIKKGMDITRQIVANPERGAFNFVTQKINSIYEGDSIELYYRAEETLHAFLSDIASQSNSIPSKIEKNNEFLNQIIVWLKQAMFDPSCRKDIPYLLPDTQKLKILHRLCKLSNFFNDNNMLFRMTEESNISTRGKQLSYLKNIFDNGLGLNQLLKDDELKILIEHLDAIDNEITFIETFFDRWFSESSNQKSRNKLSIELSQLYFFDMNNIIIPDGMPDPEIWSLYRINRFLLHALCCPHQSRTPEFMQSLIKILTMNANRDLSDNHGFKHCLANFLESFHPLINEIDKKKYLIFIDNAKTVLDAIWNADYLYDFRNNNTNQIRLKFGIELFVIAVNNNHKQTAKQLLRVSNQNGHLDIDIDQILTWCISQKDISLFLSLFQENLLDSEDDDEFVLLPYISESKLKTFIQQIDFSVLTASQFSCLFKITEAKMGFITALKSYPEEKRLPVALERITQIVLNIDVVFEMLSCLAKLDRIACLTRATFKNNDLLLLIKKNPSLFIKKLSELIDIDQLITLLNDDNYKKDNDYFLLDIVKAELAIFDSLENRQDNNSLLLAILKKEPKLLYDLLLLFSKAEKASTFVKIISAYPSLLGLFSETIEKLIDANELMKKINQNERPCSLLSDIITIYPCIGYELLAAVPDEYRINALINVIFDNEQQAFWQSDHSEFLESIKPLINETLLIDILQAKTNHQGDGLVLSHLKNKHLIKMIMSLAPSMTNQLKAAQIVQKEIDKLMQYNEFSKNYKAKQYEKNKTKKIEIMKTLYQFMPDNEENNTKSDLGRWIDTYDKVKHNKHKALAELQQWFFDDNRFGLQADLAAWIKTNRKKNCYYIASSVDNIHEFQDDFAKWKAVEKWLLDYMQLNDATPDYVEKYQPILPENLTQDQRNVLNFWKKQYQDILNKYASEMIALNDIRQEDTCNPNPDRMRTSIIKNQVAESVIINNQKIKALQELQLSLLELRNPDEAYDVLDRWIDNNNATMVSNTATLKFFNPSSMALLSALKSILINRDITDDTTANRSSSSWQ